MSNYKHLSNKKAKEIINRIKIEFKEEDGWSFLFRIESGYILKIYVLTAPIEIVPKKDKNYRFKRINFFGTNKEYQRLKFIAEGNTLLFTDQNIYSYDFYYEYDKDDWNIQIFQGHYNQNFKKIKKLKYEYL